MRARYLAVGLAGAAYVAATHWLMTRAPASDWNAVVVVGPMLVLASLYAARRRMRLLAAAAGLVALVTLVAVSLMPVTELRTTIRKVEEPQEDRAEARV